MSGMTKEKYKLGLGISLVIISIGLICSAFPMFYWIGLWLFWGGFGSIVILTIARKMEAKKDAIQT